MSVEGGLLADWGGPGSENRASAHFLSEDGVRGKPKLVMYRILGLEGNAELGGGVQTVATCGPSGSCLHVSVPCTAPSSSYVSIWVSSGEGNGTPLQYSCLENPMNGGAWWAAVHGVATSWTRLSDFTFTFHFHALEEEMATHSSVLAWRIPGTGVPGGLPSLGSHRVGHD